MEPQTESEAAGVRASRDVMQISAATDKALKRLSEASKDDVKGVAASQIELLSRFYDLSLTQAGHSFRWALVASIVGFLFFVAALGVAMTWGDGEFSGVARIATIGGVISEFIAGVVVGGVLGRRDELRRVVARAQLARFHDQRGTRLRLAGHRVLLPDRRVDVRDPRKFAQRARPLGRELRQIDPRIDRLAPARGERR